MPKEKLPYRALTRLFRFICKDECYEELQGDLEESHKLNVLEMGERKARQIYLRELLAMVRPSVIKKTKLKIFSTMMLSNYFKITFRSFTREKLFATVNILGLAIGIAACFALLMYTNHESSYDSFYPQPENIFRVAMDQNNPTTGAIEFQNAQVFYGLHQALLQEVPEVKHAVQLFSAAGIFDVNSQLTREEKLFMTTSAFFDVFEQSLLMGTKSDIDKANVIFLAESTAKKYFGDASPIGKRIILNSGLRRPFDLEVRGVFQDFPANAHLKMNGLISMVGFEAMVDENQFFGPQLRFNDVRWRWMQFYTYVRSHAGTDASALETKIAKICRKHRKPFDDQQGRISNVLLQPVQSIHLASSRSGELETPGSLDLIRFLFAISILIVVVAWINYVNLATAKAVNRAKEVGVRKVVGAARFQLRQQFLFESVALNVLALMVAGAIVYLSIPAIESLMGVNIVANSKLLDRVGMFVLAILFGSVLAGLYPAFVLSSFEPIMVLKGKFSRSKSGVYFRKGLVVFQFVIAVFLLTGILAVTEQVGFMTTGKLGLNIDSTLVVQRPPLPANQPESRQKVEAFRDKVQALSGVEAVSVNGYVPGPEIIWKQTCFISGNSDKSVLLARMGVDADYLKFFEIELKNGYFFTGENRGGTPKVVVNEKLVQEFGFKSNDEILGKSVEFPGGQAAEISGVMANFHHRGLRFPVDPVVMHLDSAANGQFIAIKTKPENLASVREQFQSLFPSSLFEFYFLEDRFKDIYAEDRRFQKIITVFTFIALSIACLGLLGLSSFTLAQRIKEISIRKVLGAQATQLFGMIMKEYIWLAIISICVSVPFAHRAVNQWLSSFATRMELSIWIFAMPALLLVFVIVTTIGYQVLKAIWVNPSESLKGD